MKKEYLELELRIVMLARQSDIITSSYGEDIDPWKEDIFTTAFRDGKGGLTV